MALFILGEHPLAKDEHGRLRSRIGTVFLSRPALVTVPGIHATQRVAWVEFLNRERREEGRPPLNREEELAEWERSVDLIMEEDRILIRPDPEEMAQAFAADEALQELVSKSRIRFLQVMDERVRRAIKQRGECWRISPLPQSPDEMKKMIRNARMKIAGPATYYYNMITGARFLTCAEFARLEEAPAPELARQLREIQELSAHLNPRGEPEVDFFAVAGGFGAGDFNGFDFLAADPAALLARYRVLREKFESAVPPECREDDLDHAEWRNRMFSALVGARDETVSDEVLHGLSAEFYMQIEWLPGGRIEDGELIFDSVFDEAERCPQDADLRTLCDDNVKGIIFNLMREFGELECVNVGRVVTSLSRRAPLMGRRDVYIVELSVAGAPAPVVRIVRMQKWGIREHLQQNKDLLRSILEAEEYTQYILDRRLGCRQLGMVLPPRVTVQRLYERYRGDRGEDDGPTIWATYFERDYIRGVASDKIPLPRYANPEYSLRLARLLGRAAASSIIVGRLNQRGEVLFDDGDELVIEDADGLPEAIEVADHTGTFVDYRSDLLFFARDYAQPVNRRVTVLPNLPAFAQAYLDAFIAEFRRIQEDYRRKRRAFGALFKHRRRDEQGSFAYRWERVLERLDRTDAAALGENIRRHFILPVAG